VSTPRFTGGDTLTGFARQVSDLLFRSGGQVLILATSMRGWGGIALFVEVDLVHVAAERRGEMKPINASVRCRVARQAATPVSRPKILAMSRGVAPSTTRPRNSKSIETVWSAASIFATRD